jgi:tRNA A-37 threonylcarbamoyl transferase component Bud32
MPAPATTDDLLDLVRKSGLIEPERLDAFVGQLTDGPATEPRELVARLVEAGLLTNFQGEQFLLGKWRGFTIGKYKVLERIGSGGMGTVYLCEHLVVRRKVAVKVLPTSKADNPSALGRFYREARAAGVLDHPNLVKAHDIDQDGGLHFLIMDYIDGSNLQEIVVRFGPLSVERAAHYVAQAAAGLQHAHDSGLVHRDVKPANILLDRVGTIRVLDLGLARFSDPTDQLTLKYDDKNVLGTADYVSPEQALNSHEVDARADIYSLGATFYFLLTGQPPFPGGKIAQKLIWHQVKEPTPILQLRPDLPEELAAVVTKMMAKDPARRYQRPADVIEALSPWTALPIAQPSESEMPRLSPAVAGGRDGDRGPATPQQAPRPAAPGGRGPSTQNMVPGSHPSGPAPAAQADVATPRVLAAQAVTEVEAARPSQPAAAPPVRPSELLPTNSAAPAPPHGPLWVVRIIAILVAGAVMGVCLRWSITQWRAASPSPSASAGGATWVVTRSGERGTFATVREALRRAKPGDRVEVREDTWQEALELADGVGSGIRLEGRAPGGKPVVWRALPGHKEDRPLVQVSGVGGLSLSGFTFDGQGRLKELVSLAGACPGLTLEDVTLQGFEQSAVALHRCGGEEGRPVVLRRVRAVPGRGATAALLLEARAGEPSRHVRVSACRLEGPYQAAVLLSGPAADLAFEGNRVYNAADGLLVRKGMSAHPVALTLAGNTFCDVEKVGVHFEESPADGSRVALTNNLFARTGTLARVDDFDPQPPQVAARWVWAPPGPGGEYRYFRKAFTVADASVSEAVLSVAGDASFTAWVNGERVGRGEFEFRTRAGHGEFNTLARRVHAFDVARLLRPGVNVIAVEASGRTASPGVLAQLTYVSAGGAPVTVASDGTWRAGRQAPRGWERPGWDDTRWPAARVVAPYGQGPAGWQRLVWDVVVQGHFHGRAGQLFPEPSGNFRDLKSQEGFPLLKAVAHHFELPTDGDDATFLRYPRSSPLTLVGSPGVPPAGGR